MLKTESLRPTLPLPFRFVYVLLLTDDPFPPHVIQIYLSYPSDTYMLLVQLHGLTEQEHQLVHLPNVSLIFLYKFMESVSFMNSRTTSP